MRKDQIGLIFGFIIAGVLLVASKAWTDEKSVLVKYNICIGIPTGNSRIMSDYKVAASPPTIQDGVISFSNDDTDYYYKNWVWMVVTRVSPGKMLLEAE